MAFQGDSIYWVEVEKVVPNPFQPRREFDEAKLRELAESIRMYGVLQPLTVTRREVQREDGTFYSEYELIAGERRLRASRLAQVPQVPVIIRTGEQSEQEKLELAIIENLQREDLNAVDRALAFKQLAEVFGLAHGQVAQKVGRSREYVSNSIRLLGLREHILDALRRGELTEGHARTLLMLNDRPEEQDVVFQEILLKKLSVREVERIARKIATDKVRKKDLDFDAELIEIEKRFTETLGTRVQIQKTDFGGKVTIDYFSTEDLEVILQRIRSEEDVMSERVAAEDDIPPVEAMEQLLAATPLETVHPTTTHTPTTSTQFQAVHPVVAPVMNPYEMSSTPTTPTAPVTPPVATSAEPPMAYVPPPVHVPQSVQPVTAPLTPPAPSFQPYVPSQPTYTPITQVHAEPVQMREVPAPYAPVETSQPQVLPPVAAEVPAPVVTPEPVDDSGLYSVRNFTV
jgi:ParB family chromosome partitioning protein